MGTLNFGFLLTTVLVTLTELGFFAGVVVFALADGFCDALEDEAFSVEL